MAKYLGLFIFLALVSIAGFAQTVYPTKWWTGMKYNSIQLLIHDEAGETLSDVKISYPGITIKQIHRFRNAHYIAADIEISKTAKPGDVTIQLKGINIKRSIQWSLAEKKHGNGSLYAQGVTAADLIYLIIPDRFSNGDQGNDRIATMNDTNCNRNNPFLRHGGDLAGIQNHLDYIKDLGATALWLTPVVENNQALTDEGGTMRSSYHGYAFTDQYQVDRRLGGNEAYKKMIAAAHEKKLKIIQDAVYNHVGNQHFLFTDPPDSNWFNQWPKYTNTSYRDEPLIDQYASKNDYNLAIKGWFTPFMPDLNQQNPFVARFLIQHALWTVEEFGIDGWRVDTYFYSDRNFLNAINAALYREYPKISIFGETTMQSVTEQAYYMDNNIKTDWKSNLQGVTDYQWSGAVLDDLKDTSSKPRGTIKLYETLVQDILYKDPMRNEIFFDNHDQNRFFSTVHENLAMYKMGIGLLLTQRGIPQLYYGTEVLMKNLKDPTDAEVRRDFPGGWKEDSVNKFGSAGRTVREQEAFNYVQKLARFREGSSAIKTGRFMQFLPVDGVYVYFRYNLTQTVMCVVNFSSNSKPIDLSRFGERIKTFSKAFSISDNNVYLISQIPSIPGKTMWVLDLH